MTPDEPISLTSDESRGIAPDPSDVSVRLTCWVRGRVQGVGFRWATRAAALELGLTGWAANLADGRVEVVAQGPRPDAMRLLAWLGSAATPGDVTGLTERWGEARGNLTSFVER